jgi:hypothetical protein
MLRRSGGDRGDSSAIGRRTSATASSARSALGQRPTLARAADLNRLVPQQTFQRAGSVRSAPVATTQGFRIIFVAIPSATVRSASGMTGLLLQPGLDGVGLYSPGLQRVTGWAEKRGLRPDGSNPCRHVEKYREGRRERFLSQAELGRLGDALREAEQSCSPWVVAAIRLLALTGARRNEILTLQWDHVSEEHGCLMLPDSKTGRKAIRLSPPALALLQSIPRLEGNPYVICGERAGRHLVNLEKPWRRIRATAGLNDVRLHDLRHSFASVAASGGQSLVVIGKLLGHSQPATTARYAHLADDPVRAASDAIGERIAAAMDRTNGGVI